MTYILADYLSTVVGVMVFTFVRFFMVSDIRLKYVGMADFFYSPGLKLTLAIFPLFMLGLYYLSGYYVNVTDKSRVTEFLTTLISCALGSFAFFMVVLLNDVLPKRVMNYEVLLVFFGCLFLPVYLTRLVVTSCLIIRHRSSRREKVVVLTVGTSDVDAIGRVITRSNKEVSVILRLKGEGGDGSCPDEFLKSSRLNDELRKAGANAFVLAIPPGDVDLSMRVLGSLYPLDRPVYVSPDDYMMLVSKVPYDNLLSEPLVDISRSALTDSVVSMKRASDVLFASIGLVFVSPVIALLGVAVKLTSPGSVIYSQERVGFHRKPFRIYKLRTMRADAEAEGPSLSTDDDPRITPIGRVMRKYRLDELPNLWNVLCGDMSLVGPRPEREFYLRQLRERAPHCALLHQVRPGLTSLGMVKFGYASNVDDMIVRLKYDLLYIQNISVSLDLKVLFYTVRTIFRGEGK